MTIAKKVFFPAVHSITVNPCQYRLIEDVLWPREKKAIESRPTGSLPILRKIAIIKGSAVTITPFRVYNLTAAAKARCIAEGVPAGGYDQGNSQIRINSGGFKGLTAEESTNKTFGVVWSPGFIDGFDVSLDWWNIQIDQGITQPSAQEILNQCIKLNNPLFCQDPNLITGQVGYTRFPGGAINNLLSVPQNRSVIEVEGYDMTMNYRMPETAWGKFSFTWDSTYMANYEFDQNGNNLVGEYSDRNNNWRLRSNLLARWEMGDFGATYASRFYSRQDEDCSTMAYYGFGDLCSDKLRQIDDPDTAVADLIPAPQNSIGGTTYHDVSVYWKAPWNAKITLGVNNLFDKQPPLAYSTFANTFDPQYEVPGQVLYFQYNQKF